DILTIDIACLSQPLFECGNERRVGFGGSIVKKSDDRNRFLRERSERPDARATDNGNELAALHGLVLEPRGPILACHAVSSPNVRFGSKAVICGAKPPCPLYSRKRHQMRHRGMFALGQ